MRLDRLPLPGGLAEWLRAPAGTVTLAWLGQAGFLLRIGAHVVLIDPYLSDHLATRYRGRGFAHERMMAPPILATEIPRVDLVLCTHRHGDHMDPPTLSMLAQLHPECRFAVPAPECLLALSCGIDAARLILAEAGKSFAPLPGCDLLLRPVAAAHEVFEQDRQGRHHFLGYGIETCGVRLYHSGDCIPYPGLPEAVRGLAPDLALLPVNGRDATRAAASIPGNFTLDEAAALCHEAAVPVMIAHHFGLFAFNTLDPALIDERAASPEPPRVLRADVGCFYELTELS